MAAEKSELRQLAPNHLPVLKAEVVKVGHEAMDVARCLQGNPLLSDDARVNP